MLNKIVKLIEENQNIVLFHHLMMDGDSLSSSYGLMKALKKKYPQKNIKWMLEKEYAQKRFASLDIDYSDAIDEINGEYLAIVGDVSSHERIYNGKYLLNAKQKIIFDHHQNDTNIENVDVFWHEPTYPASAIQAYQIAKHLQIEFDPYIALMLFYGVLTDTGRFAYSLTNLDAIKTAYELFEYISDNDLQDVYQNMQMRTLKDIRLQAHVLSNFKIKEKVAYFTIDHKKQKELDLTPDDCARVNLLSGIEKVDIWLFFIEYPDFIRVEFRSKGTPVNEIAKFFGGGGHIKASGCHLDKMSEHTKVVEKCLEAL